MGNELAALAGMLVAVLVNPFSIAIGAAATFWSALNSRTKRWLFVIGTTVAVAVVFYSIDDWLSSGQKVRGTVAGIIGSVIWFGLFTWLRDQRENARERAHEANPDPFYLKHKD